MRASTSTSTILLSLLALLPTTLCAPVASSNAVQVQETAFPNYSVTNYTTGCSPAGCVYDFDISYTPASSCEGYAQICEPAFSTHCNGTDIQGELRACHDELITTNEIPGWSNVTLQIRHQWDQDVTTGDGGVDGRFWAVANHTVVVGVGNGGKKASFEVGVVEIGGVA